jgi:hypothetical protein
LLFFFRKEGLAFLRLLALAPILTSAGCIAPDFLHDAAPENTARVLGFPVAVSQPLAPMAGNAWPAAGPLPATMLDFLAERGTTASARPSAAPASRGDFGMCLPSAPHLDSRGQLSTAPPGAALGVC